VSEASNIKITNSEVTRTRNWEYDIDETAQPRNMGPRTEINTNETLSAVKVPAKPGLPQACSTRGYDDCDGSLAKRKATLTNSSSGKSRDNQVA
jgi:hypothetical protein